MRRMLGNPVSCVYEIPEVNGSDVSRIGRSD